MSLNVECSFVNLATLLATLLLLLFYLWAKYKQTYWSRRGVHSPSSAHWLFGHLRDAFLLRASPLEILRELYRSNADRPVVGFYVLQKPFLLLRDHEIVKRVFVKDAHVFPDRYFAAHRKRDRILISGLFSVDSPRWRYLRTKLSPAFTSGKQRRLFELMLESAENMRLHLRGRVVDEATTTTIESRRVSTKYTTDVISSLSYGIRTNSFDEPEPEFYVRSRQILANDFRHSAELFINFFFPRFNDFVSPGILHPYTDYFRRIFWESMGERERSGVKRGDIVDLLVELKNERQSEEFTFEGDYLLAQSHNFFVAGLDTSATTMCFTLMEIARHPEVQERVREELREKLGNEKFTYERVAEISYLQQAINETLRLHPIAPLLDRCAAEDYKIPGTDIVIEKGTAVYAHLTGLHYDPEHHPNPEAFDPDRFSEERKQSIKPCTFMPFGEGPRICIAKRVGVLMTMVGLITILREYEVSWDPKYASEMTDRNLFGAPADGIHLSFKRSPIVDA